MKCCSLWGSTSNLWQIPSVSGRFERSAPSSCIAEGLCGDSLRWPSNQSWLSLSIRIDIVCTAQCFVTHCEQLWLYVVFIKTYLNRFMNDYVVWCLIARILEVWIRHTKLTPELYLRTKLIDLVLNIEQFEHDVIYRGDAKDRFQFSTRLILHWASCKYLEQLFRLV